MPAPRCGVANVSTRTVPACGHGSAQERTPNCVTRLADRRDRSSGVCIGGRARMLAARPTFHFLSRFMLTSLLVSCAWKLAPEDSGPSPTGSPTGGTTTTGTGGTGATGGSGTTGGSTTTGGGATGGSTTT